MPQEKNNLTIVRGGRTKRAMESNRVLQSKTNQT